MHSWLGVATVMVLSGFLAAIVKVKLIIIIIGILVTYFKVATLSSLSQHDA